MFDFISYSRDSGFEIKILPPVDGVLIHLELRDPDTGYFERRAITDRDASSCSNIDKYTGQVLDSMAAKIGARKAQLYANRHKRYTNEIHDSVPYTKEDIKVLRSRAGIQSNGLSLPAVSSVGIRACGRT